MDKCWVIKNRFARIISRVEALRVQNYGDAVQGKHFQSWGWMYEDKNVRFSINQSIIYLVESRRHAIVVATDTQETQG